jgi:barstar (barnase inhibitor)
VTRVEVVADGPELHRLIEERGDCRVFHVDTAKISTLGDVIRSVGEAIGAPSYFGQNLDALEESLRDLEGSGWCLIFANAERLLRLPREQLETLISLLSDVGDFWQSEGVHFTTVLVGDSQLRDIVAESRRPGQRNSSGS